jgi:gas vesicle protein
MFKYVRTFLIAILKTVLKFIIRQLAWLILLALVTNFFEDIRKKLLEYIDKFKQKIDESCQTIKKTFRKVVDSITIKLDEMVTKSNQMINSVKSLTALVGIKSQSLEEKVIQMNAIFEIPKIKKIIEKKGITVPNLSDDLDEIKTKIDTANDEIEKYGLSLTQSRDKVVSELEELPTTQLDSFCETINENTNHIIDNFTLEELTDLLEVGLDRADDKILEETIENINFDSVIDNDEPEFLKGHKWLKLKHQDKPYKDSKEWKLNDIYRILVTNFSREERLALATQLGKKDYLKEKGKEDRSKWA